MEESWDEPANLAVAEVPEIKLFGRWSADDVQVSDISLTVSMRYLVLCSSTLYFIQKQTKEAMKMDS